LIRQGGYIEVTLESLFQSKEERLRGSSKPGCSNQVLKGFSGKKVWVNPSKSDIKDIIILAQSLDNKGIKKHVGY